MFESTRPFTLFDYFRVPYDQLDGGAAGGVPGLASLAVHGESRTLSWLAAPTLAAGGRRSSSYVVSSMRLFDSMRLFGHIATAAEVRGWLKRFGGGWRSLHQLRDEQGICRSGLAEGRREHLPSLRPQRGHRELLERAVPELRPTASREPPFLICAPQL